MEADDEQSDQAERMEGDEQEFDGDKDDPFLEPDPESLEIDDDLKAYERKGGGGGGDNPRLRCLLEVDTAEETKEEEVLEKEEEEEGATPVPPALVDGSRKESLDASSPAPPAKRKVGKGTDTGSAGGTPRPAKRKPAGKAAAKVGSSLEPEAERVGALVRQHCNDAKTVMDLLKRINKGMDVKKVKADAAKLESTKGTPRLGECNRGTPFTREVGLVEGTSRGV
eukprot:Hpha_TRINITY_DN15504_c0_g1::TRINITY_DN15504_c0_g1_i6::g.107087::m.107087